MTTTIQAKNLSLYELEQTFNLTQADPIQFESLRGSPMWAGDLPTLSSADSSALTHITSNYNNQVRYLPLSESLVKMVVISPLLDLAGFYGRNFRLITEEPVEILLKEDDEIIKGRIDVLIVQGQFWILAIESKRVQLDVMAALPQLLVYLLDSPLQQPDSRGLMTNGREFVFAQLLRSAPDSPKYMCSDTFSINRPQEFQTILSVLRSIAATFE